MYNNLYKKVFAVAAPLAMMVSAKDTQSLWVTPERLYEMSKTGEAFEMSSRETLDLLMDYDQGLRGDHWELAALLGASYSVDENYYCTMKECTVSWKINYVGTNESDSVIDAQLDFYDNRGELVPVGLRIEKGFGKTPQALSEKQKEEMVLYIAQRLAPQ